MRSLTLLLPALTLLISSCSTTKSIFDFSPKKPAQVQSHRQINQRQAAQPTQANQGKRRNPDMALPYDISKSSSVTWSAGDRSKPLVALTFDDGPHPTLTPRLLDILRARNVKATFYVIGKNAAAYPHIMRRIVAEGHEIGNHTYTHPNLAKLSQASVKSELDRTSSAIATAAGVRPRTMRPPYGSLRKDQRVWIQQTYGYPTIMWDVDPLDWKRPGSGVVSSRLSNGARNGSILLAHDIHAGTIEAMPSAIDAILAKGLRFVTVSQLINQSSGQ